MSDKKKFEVHAFHVGHRIDLQRIRENYKAFLAKREQSFLLYRVDDYSYIYFKDYGSIVFMNCSTQDINDAVKSIDFDLQKLDKLPAEKFKIIVDPESAVSIDFDRITLPKFGVDIAHIVMLNLSQSVALIFYSNQAYDLIENNRIYLSELQESGRIGLSQRKMKKIIGRTMNLKNKIAENLYIFDTPDLAWNTETLSVLDNKLKEETDIKDRYHDLQHNIDTIKETLDLFKDILQHKHSSQLEWIIILLIFFEIIQVIVEKF